MGAPTLSWQAEGHTDGGANAKSPDGSSESQTPGMHGNSMRGNQEIPVTPDVARGRRAGRGTHKDTPFAHVAGKSDHCVVPEKAPNKGRKARGGAGGKAMDQGEPHGGTHGPDADRDYPCPSESMGCGKLRKCGFPPSIRDKSRVR